MNFIDMVAETGVAAPFSGHHTGFKDVEGVTGHRADSSGNRSSQEFLDQGFSSSYIFDRFVETWFKTAPRRKLV